MTQQFDTTTYSSERLEDLFKPLKQVGATLTALAYEAIERSTNNAVIVWRTRGPISDEDIDRFLARLASLKGMPTVQAFTSFGVDADRLGFAVLPTFAITRIDSVATTQKELERRFDGCLSVLQSLHSKAIACGDLCMDSFVLNERGSVSLFAVLGDVNLAYADEEFDQRQFLAFRPPEQSRGGRQNMSVDVFALSWLAESLFSIQPTESSRDGAQPPRWLKNILQATNTQQARQETSSALALRLVLDACRSSEADGNGEEGEFSLVSVGARLSRGSASFESNESTQAGRSAATSSSDLSDSPIRVRAAWRVAFDSALASPRIKVLLALNVVALVALTWSFLREAPTAVAPMKVSQEELNLEAAELLRLYNSSEPDAHAELVSLMTSASSLTRKHDTFRSILYRSRRLGLFRTADVGLFHVLGRDARNPFDEKGIVPFLTRVLDPAASHDQRAAVLAQAYEKEPRLATMLAAALTLDGGQPEPYQGLLARAASSYVGGASMADHGAFALILMLPETHDLFAEDVLKGSGRLSPGDVSWLLSELGARGAAGISTIAVLASRLDEEKGARSVFLAELQRSAVLSRTVRTALASGAVGRLSLGDVKVIGAWYGGGASRALQASILSSSDSGVRAAAFQALLSKPLDDPYIVPIMDFLRGPYAAHSEQVLPVFAALALRESIDSASVVKELTSMPDVPGKLELLRVLMKGAPDTVVETIVTQYHKTLEPLDLIDLLEHSSSRVRSVAVANLGDVNDIFLLKLISQSYEKEMDPKVRAIYESKVGVIRERARNGV